PGRAVPPSGQACQEREAALRRGARGQLPHTAGRESPAWLARAPRAGEAPDRLATRHDARDVLPHPSGDAAPRTPRQRRSRHRPRTLPARSPDGWSGTDRPTSPREDLMMPREISAARALLVLIVTTLAFAVCFAAWMMFGVTGIPIGAQLKLNASEFGLLTA